MAGAGAVSALVVTLSDYECTLCALHSHEAARTQEAIEFGSRFTKPRSAAEITRDILIGKRAEAAVAKALTGYGLHLPVNYDVYPEGQGDDADFVVNGWTIDVKSTRWGRFAMFPCGKLEGRKRQGKLPDVIILCRTPWDDATDSPKGRDVEIMGCISTERLMDGRNRINAGDYIPNTRQPLQASNYAVSVDSLNGFDNSVSWMIRHKKEGAK